ncbi:hypothetical protein HRbin30_02073 [bacterium HR30]|nr:hypothetical protein HRbin30_02073 [bacterium HR30]
MSGHGAEGHSASVADDEHAFRLAKDHWPEMTQEQLRFAIAEGRSIRLPVDPQDHVVVAAFDAHRAGGSVAVVQELLSKLRLVLAERYVRGNPLVAAKLSGNQ